MANLLGGTSKSTQSSTSALDPQIKDAFLKNYGNVQDTAASLPVQQFAPQSGQYFAGQDTVNNAAGTATRLQSANPMFVNGVGYDPTFANATGYAPMMGRAAQLNGNDVQNYMSPYTAAVTNTTLSDLDRARRMSLVDNNATATRSGAFGGTRQAVADSLTNEAFGRTAASTLANLNNTGYNSALAAAQADVNKRQETALTNLGYGNEASRFGAGAFNTASLANAGSANNASAFTAGATNTANLANQNAYMENQRLQLAAAALANTIGGNQANLGMTNQAYAQAIMDAPRNLTLQQIALNNQALGLNPAGGSGMVSSGQNKSSSGSGLFGFASLFG